MTVNHGGSRIKLSLWLSRNVQNQIKPDRISEDSSSQMFAIKSDRGGETFCHQEWYLTAIIQLWDANERQLEAVIVPQGPYNTSMN